MNNLIITIILSLFFAVTNIVHAAVDECRPPFARQVVDQLMVANIEQAHQILERWKQAGSSELMQQFYHSLTLWTVAETSTGEVQKKAQKTALNNLENLLNTLENSNDTFTHEQRLVKGMTQAFAGRTYLAQNSWLDAYKYGRAGRDTLRQLIAEDPTQEDAYLILGLYEYYTGTVPSGWKWLTSAIDLKGDAKLGLQYLERAAEHAVLAAPEATRMLLNGLGITIPEACNYLSLAADMRDYYIAEPHYSFELQKRYLACGFPQDAFNENRRINKALKKPEDIRKNSYLFLNAAKDLGDIEAVNKLESTFNNDSDYWLLMKAETLGLNKQRERALALYKIIYQSKTANSWVKEQSAMYIKSEYQPPQSQITDKQLSLNIPCDKTIDL